MKMQVKNENIGLYREAFEHDNCGIGAVVPSSKSRCRWRPFMRAFRRGKRRNRIYEFVAESDPCEFLAEMIAFFSMKGYDNKNG